MLWPILLAAPPALPEVTLTPGMKITSSVRVRPGTYILPNTKEDGTGAAIFIEGDNITIDLSGVTIRGTEPTVEPDQRTGTGLLIEGTGVEIRNAKVHGYKVGIMARHSPGLKITNSDLSYNWKQHLKSTLEKEDTSDWMSYHQNDKNEWLRYGAALYLDNCDRFEVRDVVARGGQNGLMMTRTDGGLVWNSDFSFLSSVGVGMYRSSGNRIMHNNIDWCVRGYSHGVYNRGQDSTGILIYEQSHRNVFAYNSVTHGGDGFFLWAGQTTMDTGEGGCNDNLLFGNDFSHAPTNGIEATFSRNQFVNNKVMECWHGVWGGYSYDTLIAGNVFGLNAEAIAIEHGQDNKILGNTFRRDRNVLRIWQNASQDPNWGYPKHRDTKSRDLTFEWNLVADVDGPAFWLTDTENISLRHNLMARLAKPFELKGNLPGMRFENSEYRGATEPQWPAEVPARNVSFVPSPTPAAPPTMQGSGNVIVAEKFDQREYLSRFNVPWDPYARNWQLPGAMDEMKTAESGALEQMIYEMAPSPLRGGKDPFLAAGTLRGRRYILVDEWGPYDFQSPKLWPRLPVTTSADGKTQTQVFDILGPVGKWQVRSSKGVTLSATRGQVPGQVTVTTDLENPSAITEIQLEFVGQQTVDYRGVVSPAGSRVPFGFRRTNVPIQWDVKHYAWQKDTSDPRTQAEAFAAILKGAPLAQFTTNRLEITAYGSPRAGVPDNYWATVARGVVQAAPGRYRLRVTTDDGCRVRLNGQEVISNAWKYQGPTEYAAEVVLKGQDVIDIEHFEIDGYATLMVRLEPLD
ncbi:MAG TPA: right-handed parallel beta-helix repeat-containing protein [Fimbriimonadaceae bacterium]|nr:hypothetical protein [Armatimonadota bacterium]HCM74180.1 hypothetical protein [Armatimonadota bacterium]HRD30209.1 right-handed parallel beta-helix repeat-containing protein [Fimbriimonadaceae bacterium]HRE94496.1 right-handed parallel beta-helix repeat-containing protein [Fimbriimonadaceae bacterium]HRI74182.1 right-handed parallel beta-helix repeat-containing protein [Fimbriimonadaceae bacterium]